MESLAKIDNGVVGKTTCCKTPTRYDGDLGIWHCEGCDEEVTVIPQMKQWTPAENEKLKQSMVRTSKAKKVNRPDSDHLVAMMVLDIYEQAFDTAQDQIKAYSDQDVLLMEQRMGPVIKAVAFAVPGILADALYPHVANALLCETWWLKDEIELQLEAQLLGTANREEILTRIATGNYVPDQFKHTALEMLNES